MKFKDYYTRLIIPGLGTTTRNTSVKEEKKCATGHLWNIYKSRTLHLIYAYLSANEPLSGKYCKRQKHGK